MLRCLAIIGLIFMAAGEKDNTASAVYFAALAIVISMPENKEKGNG